MPTVRKANGNILVLVFDPWPKTDRIFRNPPCGLLDSLAGTFVVAGTARTKVPAKSASICENL
jgi:hypothetical protein